MSLVVSAPYSDIPPLRFSRPSTPKVGAVTRRSRIDDDFEAFFVTSYPGLLRSLTAITGNGEMAADALQDAYQRAYARCGRISRYDAPAAWVRRVAINRARDLARSEERRRRNEERASVDRPASVDAEPDLDDIPALLQTLPHRQRVAMALYYVEGLSVEQTADAMKLTSGAVKYHLNKGREKLRPLLENRADDD